MATAESERDRLQSAEIVVDSVLRPSWYSNCGKPPLVAGTADVRHALTFSNIKF